jgi:hypothetical protein
MPMQLLERLVGEQLPINVESDAEIDKCIGLVTEDLIEADIPPVVSKRGYRSYSGHAIVTSVTPKGHAATGRKRLNQD